MVSQSGFSRQGRIYLWAVILAGAVAVSGSIYQLCLDPIGYPWFILAGLTLVCGSATVRLPSSYASISISETFVFTAALLYGPAAGTIIVSLDALVISFWISKRYDEPHRVLFNLSAPAVSAWCSASLFFHVARIAPLAQAPAPINAILPALMLFALTYFGLNSWLIAFVIALERNLNPVKVWTSSFVWLSLNYFGGASVAILFVGYNRTIDLGYIGVILPLLLVLYFTFKTTMGRVEDADRHVEQLNQLYLSTIETLAMAVDAKDQVTHGHIRRVQANASSLARAIGVHDSKLLKAIEAAALLHDMGKLAVPEYILNKPGKLTGAEFEKMKLHASVGAEILSAIAFPYPVVPIVRHHHENWDGTGYPDGLSGTRIPIGARILSVVDCFDALTSDRPYRTRLTGDQALSILAERRGSMYDPLIVDTFVKIHAASTQDLLRQGPASDVLNTIARANRTSNPSVALSSLTVAEPRNADFLAWLGLSGTLSSNSSIGDASSELAAEIRRRIPAELCVFYAYSESGGELHAKGASGERAAMVLGIRIPLGQRLSGWVAANRVTVLNSDAALDLSEVAHSSSPRLLACLSAPLTVDDALVGVLALYSSKLDGFTQDHRLIVESVARKVTIQGAVQLQASGVPSDECRGRRSDGAARTPRNG